MDKREQCWEMRVALLNSQAHQKGAFPTSTAVHFFTHDNVLYHAGGLLGEIPPRTSFMGGILQCLEKRVPGIPAQR